MKYFLSSLSVFFVLMLNSQIVFNSAVTKSGSGVGSLTFTKTVSAGTNRLIYVGVTAQDKAISGVTWNGLALTQFTIGVKSSMRVAMYYLALGSSATPTTANVVVTFAAATDAFAGAGDYSGVYQTTPFINPAVNQAKSTTPSVTITSTAGNKAVSLMGDIAASPSANGAGQTQYWTFSGSHSNRSTEKAGAASVVMTHTISANEDWVMMGGTMLDYSVVLPIELVNFNSSVLENNSVNLSWQTITEKANNYFEIEKSIDLASFISIGIVKSKSLNGISKSKIDYNFIDNSTKNEITYYRLKQVNLDKTFSYSKIVSALIDKKNNVSFRIFPNPNNGQFDIDISGIENNHDLEIFILNSDSKIVYETKTTTDNLKSSGQTFHITTSKPLQTGIYNVLFVLEETKYYTKLIVE